MSISPYALVNVLLTLYILNKRNKLNTTFFQSQNSSLPQLLLNFSFQVQLTIHSIKTSNPPSHTISRTSAQEKAAVQTCWKFFNVYIHFSWYGVTCCPYINIVLFKWIQNVLSIFEQKSNIAAANVWSNKRKYSIFLWLLQARRQNFLALNKILNLLKTESERLLLDTRSISSWIRCKSWRNELNTFHAHREKVSKILGPSISSAFDKQCYRNLKIIGNYPKLR